MMTRFLLFLAMIVSTGQIMSQTDDQLYSEWILHTKSGLNAGASLKSNTSFISTRELFKDLSLIGVTTSVPIDKEAITQILGDDKNILGIYPNYQTYWRNTPNDPDFPSQWGMQTIRMLDVWDEATGGTAANGHDIVVAIFDDGYQIDHTDLAGNIWVNEAEIEDNGIDDDNNGYVDDYWGWNATEMNDDHRLRSHGTSVAGIIGAKGNNNNQVTGINWDVKMMFTSGGRSDAVSLFDVVKAYEYVHRQRKIYNDSNGENGAYVVVSNYSGGAPDLFPDDFPMWCEIYELLGQEGVLNVTSAPNSDTNVEVDGDMPTLCTTDALIVATNTDVLDVKITEAGFGSTSVDMGAPGEGSFTIGINNNTDPDFSGTSASAPHIAGVIALLYSVICEDSYQASITDPTSVSNKIKAAIFDGVDPNTSLANITTTGGRLNALNSLNIILADIGDCCAINNVSADITEETCVGASDGALLINADAVEIRGQLVYSIDGISGNTARISNSFAKLEPGEYTISLYDSENLNCVNEDTQVSITAGIDECPLGEFEIIDLRPNPASTSITINYQVDEIKLVTVQIHNTAGQLIHSQVITPTFTGSKTYDIDVRNYPMGTYMASIIATGEISTKSFLVVR